jgi:hypothetical protein
VCCPQAEQAPALPPAGDIDAADAAEAHAALCRLAHALLLGGAPGRKAAVIARRVP